MVTSNNQCSLDPHSDVYYMKKKFSEVYLAKAKTEGLKQIPGCILLQLLSWGVCQWSKLGLFNFNISSKDLLYRISPLDLHDSGDDCNMSGLEVKNVIDKVTESFGELFCKVSNETTIAN